MNRFENVFYSALRENKFLFFVNVEHDVEKNHSWVAVISPGKIKKWVTSNNGLIVTVNVCVQSDLLQNYVHVFSDRYRIKSL